MDAGYDVYMIEESIRKFDHNMLAPRSAIISLEELA